MANLTFAQIRAVWLQAGGLATLADTMAAIAMAESRGGDPNALNPESCRFALEHCQSCSLSNTGDYSVGLWQINYYGPNFEPRKARYGCPALLLDPLRNARAAVDLAGGGSGLNNWTTYTSGAYKQYLSGAPAGLRGPTGPPARRHIISSPPGVAGPVTVDTHLTKAWHVLVKAIDETMGHRAGAADRASRRYKSVVLAPRRRH